MIHPPMLAELEITVDGEKRVHPIRVTRVEQTRLIYEKCP